VALVVMAVTVVVDLFLTQKLTQKFLLQKLTQPFFLLVIALT